jgi:hypothetical protein
MTSLPVALCFALTRSVQLTRFCTFHVVIAGERNSSLAYRYPWDVTATAQGMTVALSECPIFSQAVLSICFNALQNPSAS